MTTPFGDLVLSWRGEGLDSIRFGRFEPGSRVSVSGQAPNEDGRHTVEAIMAFFSGERRDIPATLDFTRYTPFQVDVWRAACRVPFGETLSYGELAELAGHPSASRAVGGALNRNPYPPIVPCHRFIGANGALTGFGGGLPWKRALLTMERDRVSGQLSVFG